MNGIKRLREFVGGIGQHSVWSVTREEYDNAHGLDIEHKGGQLRDLLADIADQIEREQDASVADSPYDAILPEDSEAIAWMREHGGLSHVKDIYNDLSAVVERLGVEWSESELHGLMGVLDRRLVPEGGWPRFEDGEMVLIGSDFADWLGETHTVASIEFFEDGVLLRWNPDEPEECMRILPGERVRRPAVLAADGEPLEVGQTVWDVESGIEYEVVGIHTDEDTPVRVMRTDGSHLAKAAKLSTLTHQRPVLDADGVEIRVGDTVYLLPGDWCDKFPLLRCHEWDAMKVLNLRPNHDTGRIECRTSPDSEVCYPYPSQLTHERPDSWEQLEEDAGKKACDYFGVSSAKGCEGCKRHGMEGNCIIEKSRDLVRRAKALAERGR